MNGLQNPQTTYKDTKIRRPRSSMHTRGSLHCDWHVRYRSQLTGRDFREHITALEVELQRINGVLENRERAIDALKPLADRLELLSHELCKIFQEFSVARATLLNLTATEQRVFDLLKSARGLSMKEIAGRLRTSERVVRFHLHNIYTKAGVGGKNEL